jgi:hypothetical protein
MPYGAVKMEEKVRQHWEELSETALKVRDVLRETNWYNPGASPVICELTVDFDERDLLETLDNQPEKYLLAHIQSEFPELRRFTSWKYLKMSDITTKLLDHLSFRIEKRKFAGKCKICENWHYNEAK